MSEKKTDERPFVTVIIPFYGMDVKELRACLTAIRDQDYPAERLEVIVVDNNSMPFLETDMDEMIAKCRLAHEAVPGSYRARNRGIALARGTIFAFTDADCRPDDKWLTKGVDRLLSDPKMGFVGGQVIVTHRSRRPNIVEAYDKLMHMRQEVYVRDIGFSATANLFTYASVIEAVGNFDIEFLSGGDKEWGMRVSARGYRREYAPEAVVYHPARVTVFGMARKVRRLVGQEKLRARRSRTPYRTVLFSEILGAMGQVLHAYGNRRELGTAKVVGVATLVALLRVVRGVEWFRLGMGGKMQR